VRNLPVEACLPGLPRTTKFDQLQKTTGVPYIYNFSCFIPSDSDFALCLKIENPQGLRRLKPCNKEAFMQNQWSQHHPGGPQFQPGGPIGGTRPGTNVPPQQQFSAPLTGPRPVAATAAQNGGYQADAGRDASQRPASMESLHARYLREYQKGRKSDRVSEPFLMQKESVLHVGYVTLRDASVTYCMALHETSLFAEAGQHLQGSSPTVCFS
jgi:hypothetical protein